MARTYTPEGKLSLETKIGLVVLGGALAACGYLGLRELVRSGENPDGSPPDGNQPKSTEVLAAIDATRAVAEANGSIYTARESEGMMPAISPELAQVAGLSLIDPQTADPAELQAYSELIRNRLEKVGIRGDFQIMVVDLDLGAGARGAVPLVFNSTTGESFAVFGSDETGDTVPFNMGVGYYVWEMGRGTAGDGSKVVGLMLPAVAEGKQALAPIITVKDGEVFLQWPFNAVPKAPAEFDLIGIGPGGKKVLADLAGLPTEEFSTATPESTLTATSTATLKPTLTRTPRLTSTPRPTREFTPTPTQTEAVNTLRPDFSLDLAGVVNQEGVSLNVPFTVGLMKDIRERSLEPIKSFYVNPERPDTPDKLAYYYLRICWLNHKKNYPEHADISWEEYLGEVQAGRGLIKLALADSSTSSWDSPKKTVYSAKEISPLGGMTFIKADSLFGRERLFGAYVVENDGRLIIVSNRLPAESFAEQPDKITRDLVFNLDTHNGIFLILGADINQALKSGYIGWDVFNNPDPDFLEEYRDFNLDFINVNNVSLSKPYFIIEQ